MKNLPAPLLHDLQSVPGFDEQAFIAAHGQPAATSVRVHPVKGNGLFATNEQVPWCNSGRYLAERPSFTLDPLYHAGAYYVQEASSMFLHHLLKSVFDDKTGLRVLDLCAAPGGKSTLIAGMLDSASLLISNDVIRSRATILEENMTRWGYMNTWVTSNDPRDLGRLEGYFDVIVVDAPCSGSGLFRKDERALDEWSEANVALCSQRQQRILADVWPALKQDGILVYATCSYSPQEDEQVLEWLAGEFAVKDRPVAISPEWGITTIATKSGLTCYRFFPGMVKGEGLFIAMMQKTEEAQEMRHPKYKPANDSKIREQAAHLLLPGDYKYIQTGSEGYSAIHPAHEADLQLLQKAVYLRKAGIAIGQPAAKEWLPGHDVALSIDRSSNLPTVALSKEAALHFLKKEDIGGDGIPKGWQVVTYNGLGLGWIKSLGNRVNNYLPKHWRIRMDIGDADEA